MNEIAQTSIEAMKEHDNIDQPKPQSHHQPYSTNGGFLQNIKRNLLFTGTCQLYKSFLIVKG